MGRTLEQQEKQAREGGAVLREWDHGGHRFRLRLLRDQAHVDRQQRKSAPWRRLPYPQAVVDELLAAHREAEEAVDADA